MAKIIENPFNPGPATVPVYVAGRRSELRLIEQALQRVSGSGSVKKGELRPLAPIKIVGPRGVGKTTLLYEAMKMAESQKIQVLLLSQLNSLDEPKLLRGLVGEKVHERLLEKLSRIKGASAATVSLTWDSVNIGLEESFRKKMAKRPLLLLLDEVMHYDPQALSELLRACQELIGGRQPLAVILAGTPQTDQLLGQLKASFIERVNDIYINALSNEETLDALTHPFKLHKVKVAPAALRRMTKLTDNYPFFIQIVGLEVWEAMSATDKREVSLALVKQAEPAINKRRKKFYAKVHAKIVSADLIKHARRAMEILAMNKGKVGHEAMLSGLAGKKMGVFGLEHVEIYNQLLDRGFIWMQDDDDVEAGIPSFFDYCEQKAKKSKKATI